MLYPADLPCRMSPEGVNRHAVASTPSTRRLFAVAHGATLALSLSAALLLGGAAPAAQPVAVKASLVAASVQPASVSSSTLQLGAPRLDTTVGTVTVSALNMRTGPSTAYAVIAVLPYGTQGTVIGQSNGWYNVQTSRGTGWVYGSYFQVGGTASAPAPAPTSNVVAIARQYVGYPYVWGAAGPNAFDCSGFTQYVYGRAGISLSRTAASQYGTPGTRIGSYGGLQPGDLMFFAGTDGPGITHVGIYAGNGQMIHAGTSYTGVEVTNIYYSYWTSHFAGGVRPYR